MKLSELPEEAAARRRETLRKYNNTPERKEYLKSWYQANRERVRAKIAQERIEDPEKFRRWYRNSNRKHREEDRVRSRALYHRDKTRPEMVTKNLFAGTVRRAKQRGTPHTITKEWVMERVLAGVCEVTGLPFSHGKGIHHPWSPTIDRIDRGGGYTPDNARLVLWAVNNFKGTGTDEMVLEIAEAIVRNAHNLKKGKRHGGEGLERNGG
jgi:hypothetical protein